jgi:GDP-L-fucose synthase
MIPDYQTLMRPVLECSKDGETTMKEVVNFKGTISFDTSKSDGSLRKLLNSERINKLGFKPKTDLKEGLIKTYKEYIKIYKIRT